MIRADVPEPERHQLSFDRQVNVVDLHLLNDRAKRPVLAHRGYKGLDWLKAEIKRGVPGMIIRKTPPPRHSPQTEDFPSPAITRPSLQRDRSL